MKTLPAIKILLVDDLDENLLALEALLRANDLELLRARSGREALELLLVHDVALALLDVQMPEMDGFELAELMRGSQRTRHVPIIFLTAGGHDAQRVFRGYEVGAVDFLFKPLDPVLLRHKVSTFVGLNRQTLENKLLADELREMLRLNEMFVAAVSHDLRSPLSSMVMGAALLERELVDPVSARVLSRIRSSADRMNGMLDQLYDLARVRLGGGIAIEPAKMSLHKLLDTVADELHLAHPEKRVAVECDGPTEGVWDVQRLGQVFTNLIGNALRYGTQSKPVRVSVRAGASEVAIDVHNGGAIDDDLRPHLFDPFRRGSGPARDNLGLGLYIVRAIVVAHGGSIELSSSHEAGTTFCVTLPREAAI
jgi:two-component system sensor histidine kinase/response regulator